MVYDTVRYMHPNYKYRFAPYFDSACCLHIDDMYVSYFMPEVNYKKEDNLRKVERTGDLCYI